MTRDYAIDLHMHSSFSDDGDFAPAALVAMAKAAGLSRVALADHNTAAGNAEFLDAARAAGLDAIPSIEIDCELEDAALHVLGYCIDCRDDRFAALHKDVTARQRAVASRRVDAVRSLGIAVDGARLAEILPDGTATGEAVAEAALENPANDGCALLLPYRAGGARADNPFVNFYWDFCSRGKAAYVHVAFMALPEAVALILDTGGVPVLAHPGQSLRGRENLVDTIAACGVLGIEAYSSYHSPEQCAHWAAEAERLGLFVTCGSDFHGKTKPAIIMGRHGAEDRGREITGALLRHLKRSTPSGVRRASPAPSTAGTAPRPAAQTCPRRQ